MAPESRDEVRQRINSLYDQAENATGNYNATRAMSSGSRTRGVPLRKRAGAGPASGVDDMTRQWFDAARGKLGPSVPAALPADRVSTRRGSGNRPSAPVTGGLPGAETTDRPLPPELTTGAASRVVAELSGPRAVAELPAARPVAELTARPVAALPAVPEPRREPASATSPGRLSPATSKGNNQRKLAAAADLLSRHAARQLRAPIAALEAAPMQPMQPVQEQPVQESWFPSQPLAPADTFTPGMPTPAGTALGFAATPDPLTAPSAFSPAAAADPLTDTGPLTFGALADTGAFPALPTPAQAAPMAAPFGAYPDPTVPGFAAAPDPLTDTGPLTFGALTDTGAFPALPTPAQAPFGTYPDPLTDPAPFSFTPAPDPLTDTGTFTTYSPSLSLSPASPASSAPQFPYAAKAMKALGFARAQIGRPCVWGATGPGSYDCSSLTQAAWKVAGVALPRSAAEQAGAGTPVSLADIQVGDLIVFFDSASHIGFSTGDGMMIHAPGPGAFIREESIYGAGESAIQRVVRPA